MSLMDQNVILLPCFPFLLLLLSCQVTFTLNSSNEGIISGRNSMKVDKSKVYEAHLVGLFVSSSEVPIFLEVMEPTLEMAVEVANEKYSNLNISLSMKSASSTCRSNRAGAIAAEKYYRGINHSNHDWDGQTGTMAESGRVSAFIGPACSLALDSVARMASYWNVPVLTAGGIDSKFSNKHLYRTLSRLSFSLGKSFLSLKFFVSLSQVFFSLKFLFHFSLHRKFIANRMKTDLNLNRNPL